MDKKPTGKDFRERLKNIGIFSNGNEKRNDLPQKEKTNKNPTGCNFLERMINIGVFPDDDDPQSDPPKTDVLEMHILK